MGKTIMAVIVVALLCLVGMSSASGQESKKELMDKLRDLRAKKAALIQECDDNMRRLDKEAEDKIYELRVNFRKSREAVLAERDNKRKQVNTDYNATIKPMLKEENKLVSLVGRDALEDFAKVQKKK